MTERAEGAVKRAAALPLSRALAGSSRGGLCAALGLYTLCALFNMNLGYQGNENAALEALVWREWRHEVLAQVGRLLTAHVLLGGLAGAVMGMVAWGLGTRRRGGAFLWGLGGTLWLMLLALLGDMAAHPHLYASTLYSRGGGLPALLRFMSRTSPGPWWLLAILPVLTAPALALWRWSRGPLVPGGALLGAGLLGLLLTWTPRPAPETPRAHPNLLILASDGLRPDHLSGNGYARRTSPHLDRLMREGSRFTQTLVQIPRTGPSWTTLLSAEWAGQHPIRHTLVGPQARAASFPTLATALREAGWQTAVLSDYAGDIFSRLPLGFEHVEAPAFDFPDLIRQRMLITQVTLLPWTALVPSLFPERQQFPELTDPSPLVASTRRVLDGLRPEAPFALLVFASVTHFPYAAPYPFGERFLPADEHGPWHFGTSPQLQAPRAPPSPEDVAALIANYDAGVLAFDDFVGRTLEELERRGLAQSTLVVVLSDHGEHLFEYGRGQGHGEHLWGSEALRVPFLLRWPGHVAVDREIPTRVRAIDVAPTLLELLGVEAPARFRGRSLAALLRPGEPGAPPPELPALLETDVWFSDRDAQPYQRWRWPYPWLYELVTVDRSTGDISLKPEWEEAVERGKHRGLYLGPWKLLELPSPQGTRVELYDVSADPHELHDVAAEHPEVVTALQARLHQERDWEPATATP